MTDLIERAARAIDAFWSEGDGRKFPYEDTEREYQAHCRDTAKAALAEAASELSRLREELAEADAELEKFGAVSPAQYQKELAAWKARAESAERRAEAMEEALRPFAAVADVDIGSDETDADTFQPMRSGYNRAPIVTVGDMRRAAAALPPKGQSPARSDGGEGG